VGHVACIGERNLYKILVQKLKDKRPLGRPRCKWENNVKVVLKEIVHLRM